MPESDQSLADAYRPTPEGDHIGDGWERFLDGEMGVEERDQASRHLTTCRECSRVYKGLLDFAALASEFDPQAPKPPVSIAVVEEPVSRNRWAMRAAGGLALAASLMIAVGLVGGRSERSTFRGGTVARAGVVLAPSNGQVGANGRVSWSPVEGASLYAVTVFAEDGRVLSRVRVPDTSASWPAEAGQPGVYFWRVSVVDPQSLKDVFPSVESPLARVEVRR